MVATSPIETTVEHLAHRHLVAPALLFLVGHRPLAFTAGHVLALVAPIADLLGQPSVTAWAEVLTTPQGLSDLENALIAAHTNEV